ncbi:hypothetical protein [Pseudarthrobacter sp. SORGH_AS 212]|uniref:hypothetical protein n=1 Tax=Pseudarthrobacter sp. SORGH_AS 212 TaxID=3041777 RepID=UPI0032B7CFEE
MALADMTPPVLSSVSLLSKKTVTVGDRVRIAWSATDASDVEGVVFWVYAPDGRIKHVKITTGHTKVGDTSSGVMYSDVIDSLTWPVGEYRVDFAQFSDAADNFADTREGNALAEGVDLSSLSFTVVGTEADSTPPVLSSVSLLSKKTVTVGDRVRIAWSATDASDVEGVVFWVYAPDGRIKHVKITTGHTKVGDTSSGVMYSDVIDSLTWPVGEYRVDFAQFSDAADNFADTREGNALGEGVDLSSLSFTVVGTEADSTPPVLSSVSLLSKKTVTVGDRVRIAWSATDASDVEGVIFWAIGPGGRIKHVYITTGHTKSGDSSSGVMYSDVIDSLTWPAGEYRVDFAQFSDAADNFADTREGNALGEGVDLSSLSFTVVEPPKAVPPNAVTFVDEDGTAKDSFTVPTTEGVEYLVGGKVTAAGTYPGSGTVTVKARALEDYVLAEGAVAEWSHEFRATPYVVSPASVTFVDEDGTANDAFTVPLTKGVQYLVGDAVKAAGTYPGSGAVTVKARAVTDYVLADGATSEWSHEFKATPYPATPAAVTFTDEDGTAEDTFTIPAIEGVEYLIGDAVKAAGIYPGSGTVTVKARAAADYVLADGATAGWSHEFKATPYQVTPANATFVDEDGTAKDTFTVPSTTGVEYLVGDAVKTAGTYPGSGTVTVKARAKAEYILASNAKAEWSHVFKSTPYPVTPAAVTFTDKAGTSEDTFTIPTKAGVEYVVGDLVKAAGTYPASGTVSVRARATTDYVLAAGAAVEWSQTFSSKHPAVPGSMIPVAPFRALDTRNSATVQPDGTVSFQVAGVGGVPSGVSAVVFNMTVADAKSFGFVTAYASGSDRPDASNLNFDKGQIVANSVTVPVGADGKVTLFNRSAGATHLLADVSGYYLPGTPTAAGAFASISPSRFLDTRKSAAVASDGAVSFQVAGVGGVPAGVSAVVMNLTVAEAKANGFITAYPAGTDRPNASNVNFDRGQIIPNAVTVPVGADGKVTLFNRSGGSTHLLADVSGYYLAGTPTAAGTFKAVAPTRFLDTRNSAPARADGSVSFQVGGANGVPADASAVVFNLTVADAASFGFVTAHASGTNRPNASNVNFDARQIVPNLVVSPVGGDGKVSLFNRSAGTTHLVADVSGYFLAG